jgi:hypothetical protein
MDATHSVPETKHSPVLSAELSIHGHRFNVAALGPDHVVVRSSRPVPPGQGVIRLTIDDQLTIHHVELPEGVNPSRREQHYRLLEARSMPPINAA